MGVWGSEGVVGVRNEGEVGVPERKACGHLNDTEAGGPAECRPCGGVGCGVGSGRREAAVVGQGGGIPSTTARSSAQDASQSRQTDKRCWRDAHQQSVQYIVRRPV